MIPIGFMAAFGTGAGPRFRWGLAGLGFVCGIMLLLMILDDLDSYESASRRYGVPLAISQLGLDKASHRSMSWKDGRENVFASAPLASILASRLGIVSSNESPGAPTSIWTMTRLQLSALNSSSIVKILPFDDSNIGLLVASNKLTPEGEPYRSSIAIWARPATELLRKRTRFGKNLSPRILSDDWHLVTEIDQTGHVEKIAYDLSKRCIAVSLKTFGEPFRTLTLLDFDEKWSVVRQKSMLASRPGPVVAMALTRGNQFVFALTDDNRLFSSVDLDDFGGAVFDGPNATARIIESLVTSIDSVPALSTLGTNRIIVTTFLANSHHQQYSTKLYDFQDGTWFVNENFSGKPFASKDTSVSLPNIYPSSNFIAESSTRMVCLSSTPFVMSIDTSLESNAIKIINLESKIQFTHIALDESGELIALADNSNNVVFLERTYHLDSPLFWEVQSEFSLPSNLEDYEILSIALYSRGTVLIAVLQGGVVVSFDLRHQNSDNVSVFLELHWELLLVIVSIVTYVFMTRIGRNITGINNVFIPGVQRFRPVHRQQPGPAFEHNPNT